MRADQCLLEGMVERGERDNFAALVRKYYGPLLRFCTRMVGCPYRAEDIVQESFIKSYRSVRSLKNRSSFRSWLYRIAINTARNELRLKREEPMEIDEKLLDPTSGADVAVAQTRVARILRAFVEELPRRQKQALCLRVYDDLSFREIAQIMSCPYDTAKANYRHAVLRLKEVLATEKLSREDLRVQCRWGGKQFFKTGAEG